MREDDIMCLNNSGSPNYIVANAVLAQSDSFTFEIIYDSVKERLESLFGTVNEIKVFISQKLSSLCEIGLISDTGLGYYRI